MDETQFTVYLMGIRGNISPLVLRKNSTVNDLLWVTSTETGIPTEQIRLLFAASELREDNTLAHYKIQHGSTVFMVLRLPGGWNPLESIRLKKANLTPLPPFIKLTTSVPDMISLDDDPNVPRAVMPCGHVIGTSSMTSYCQSLLSSSHFTFKCPYVDVETDETCDVEWEYCLVRHVACLSPEEQHKFEISIAKNYLLKTPGIKRCPGCQTYCERLDKRNPRVECPVCSRRRHDVYEFCWHCLHEWTGDEDCGNPKCSRNEQLTHLKKCSYKNIVGVEDCPSVRACPSCGTMIEHVSDCNEMTCRGCGNVFCFICLKFIDDCLESECEIPAPIQTKRPRYE